MFAQNGTPAAADPKTIETRTASAACSLLQRRLSTEGPPLDCVAFWPLLNNWRLLPAAPRSTLSYFCQILSLFAANQWRTAATTDKLATNWQQSAKEKWPIRWTKLCQQVVASLRVKNVQTFSGIER